MSAFCFCERCGEASPDLSGGWCASCCGVRQRMEPGMVVCYRQGKGLAEGWLVERYGASAWIIRTSSGRRLVRRDVWLTSEPLHRRRIAERNAL